MRVIEPHKEQHAFRHAEVFLHERARYELVRAQAHLGLHALAAALDDANARQVVFADGRIVDQPDQERRHHLDMRHLVALDQLEHFLRPRRGREDHFATLEKIPLDAGAGEGQVVRDRQREQQDRIAGDAANRSGGF